jgi:uncharacterized membrane protein YagU involved in acid resistance
VALVLHYGYGALAGAAYGVYSAKWPPMKTGSGTLFGTAVWLFGDELPISVSGLSKPFARSARSHGSALAAHLLFGVTTELARRLLLGSSSRRLTFDNGASSSNRTSLYTLGSCSPPRNDL